jgi:hypothetical protein
VAVEHFANLAETTLASGYTSGGGSISVASASGFPTSGVFRVALGNASKTIYRVDSVSGTTFTGGAEANDGNASSGQTVIICASAAVAERFMQSPETAEQFLPSGLNGADRWGRVYKVKYPITADFSWVNQGGAAIDTTFGFTRLSVPSASTSYRMRVKTAPATPYQVDVAMQPTEAGTRFGGLVFRESSTSKLVALQYNAANNQMAVVYWTNETTFNSNPANTTLEGTIIGTLLPVWLRIRDDGTNLKFTASRDGLYYFTEMSLGRTAFLAGGPNQVGFFGDVDSGASAFALDFYHWQES